MTNKSFRLYYHFIECDFDKTQVGSILIEKCGITQRFPSADTFIILPFSSYNQQNSSSNRRFPKLALCKITKFVYLLSFRVDN
jgi:hypothetical protein